MKSNVTGAHHKNAKQNNAKHKQYGGTILGIVIGLVIGLTIAVVVAMMITKTSTPFTNKLGITKGDAPAVQLTDPNKPLYGNSAKEIMANANKPADPASQNTSPSIQPAAPQVPDALKSESRTETKSESKATKAVDTPASKSESDEKSPSYYLQVGAFRDSGDAESARAKLALIGVEAHISNSDSDNLYRVRIGPFDQLDNMNRMRGKLAENSIDVAVIKTPK